MLKAPEPAQGLKARNNASVRNRNKPRRAGSGGNLSRIQFAVGAPSDWQELIALVRAYYRFDDIRFKAATVGPALKRLLEDESLGRACINSRRRPPRRLRYFDLQLRRGVWRR
jgi:hypothetical protein